MVKSVSLVSGRNFKSITEAQDHFSSVLKSQDINIEFLGAAAADISALYSAYCAKTNWTLKSPVSAFFPTHDKRPGATTLCFGVRFVDGTTTKFSLQKALRSIAE
jgi:hypothetical protein